MRHLRRIAVTFTIESAVIPQSSPATPRPAIIVMGVSGSGKSLIGAALAERLGVAFLEGDDLHPPANVAKMARGIPLDDADRAPWLAAIQRWITERNGRGGVASCSALKHDYRDTLRDGVTPAPAFVLLAPGRDTLADRLDHREGHFMPPALLDSQIATLEPPASDERAIVLGNEGDVATTLNRIADWLDDLSWPRPPRYRSGPRPLNQR